jgi:hypothetical protein
MIFSIAATFECTFEVEADTVIDAQSAVTKGTEIKTNMQITGCQAFLDDTPNITIEEICDEDGDIHEVKDD